MITSILGRIIRFIGRRTFWRLTQSEKDYLEKYYEKISNIDGDRELAQRETKLKREIIFIAKEERFYSRISSSLK
ncbi:hypothetical protein [Clostridium butyricum]|uniref:hypothetical protein n=1 Tax=Clostridium butyricum TaxID=1492 RepID=UPI0022E2BF87|nr:hypothetical protein [Clostridium butyricum]MDU3597531.1 hypothetical protein [Clostridium butyricum]